MGHSGVRSSFWVQLVGVLAVAGWGTRASADPGDHEGRDAPAVFDFAHPASIPHGVAGDRKVVFVALPLVPAVQVLDRETGQVVGQLPAPASGFLLPFSLRVSREGHLVLLDAGGFPNPFVPSVATVYDYDYHYDSRSGFTATQTRAVSFAGLPLVFAEDVEVVRDDLYVVSESVIGGLWVIDGQGHVSPGVFPDNPAVPLPQLGGCGIPNFTIEGVPVDLGFAPGVGSLAHRDDQLYFNSSCLGGLYRIPIRSLSKGDSPSARAADIVTVSARPAGTLETLEGLAFAGGEHHIYAADPFHLRLLRIDVRDGSREVVSDDPILFNFPIAVASVPNRDDDEHALIVSSDQEYRFAAFNPGITQDEFQLPFHLTEVRVER